MKTEVFIKTPGIQGTNHLTPLKSSPEETVSSVFLLDTPQNTPVGTPGSDITEEILEQIQREIGELHAEENFNIARAATQALDVPKNKSGKRNKKKRGSPPDELDFNAFYEMTDETLGRGAYAIVQNCTQLRTGKEYAVKIISTEVGHTTRLRVHREIETLYKCRYHPNIIHMEDSYEESDRFLIIFEKAHGGPLLSHIQKKKVFTEHEASSVIKDIATALDFLHKRGIAHRDVKPENILCINKDKVSPVKLCDFDLSCGIKMKDSQYCRTPELNSPVGSPEYMAPEVVHGFVQDEWIGYDKRCDLWSLGVITYMLLCGYPPFSGRCGFDCGWDRGLNCGTCQSMLFSAIQKGEYSFSGREWDYISSEAKDLIRQLLVKDASRRISAEGVLNHPWIQNGGSPHELKTPDVIRNNNSERELLMNTTTANIIQRIKGQTKKTNSVRMPAEIQPSPSTSPPAFICGMSPASDSTFYQYRHKNEDF